MRPHALDHLVAQVLHLSLLFSAPDHHHGAFLRHPHHIIRSSGNLNAAFSQTLLDLDRRNVPCDTWPGAGGQTSLDGHLLIGAQDVMGLRNGIRNAYQMLLAPARGPRSHRTDVLLAPRSAL